jgi:hypothetical protein
VATAQIVILCVGAVCFLLGATILAFPQQSRDFERNHSTERLEATIPKFWQGRQRARMRFVGTLELIGGVVLMAVAVFRLH